MLTKKFNFILISLKNTIIPFILCSFIACLILFSTTNIKAAKIGLELWATTVVPSLFPFLDCLVQVLDFHSLSQSVCVWFC